MQGPDSPNGPRAANRLMGRYLRDAGLGAERTIAACPWPGVRSDGHSMAQAEGQWLYGGRHVLRWATAMATATAKMTLRVEALQGHYRLTERQASKPAKGHAARSRGVQRYSLPVLGGRSGLFLGGDGQMMPKGSQMVPDGHRLGGSGRTLDIGRWTKASMGAFAVEAAHLSPAGGGVWAAYVGRAEHGGKAPVTRSAMMGLNAAMGLESLALNRDVWQAAGPLDGWAQGSAQDGAGQIKPAASSRPRARSQEPGAKSSVQLRKDPPSRAPPNPQTLQLDRPSPFPPRLFLLHCDYSARTSFYTTSAAVPSSVNATPTPTPTPSFTPTPTTAPTLTGVQAIALKRPSHSSPPSVRLPPSSQQVTTTAKSPVPFPKLPGTPLLPPATTTEYLHRRHPQKRPIAKLHYRADLARGSAAASSKPTSKVQAQADYQKVPQFNCRPASLAYSLLSASPRFPPFGSRSES
ncbi:hypothetical protein G7Z17_g10628 [Cylindrodendrum hubeiense]|uniref:Uncharacterized protein n=1 Tax=Cylindrodendrum hubeiense TaxID=595255 RepID=A0A9P5LB19_9HYPO|nr:hypothetical protein G7Z17_g10628 [Cylindrodendrum hubeiense]